MTLAAVLIPSSLDAKQALRLRRFGTASLSYVLATALLAVGWLMGAVPLPVVLQAAAAFVAVNLGLYLAIRSGFNERFHDPSLTRFQIVAAITVLMYVVYHMDDGRNIALFACFVVFLFGVTRLRAREFIAITLYTLAAYALVINLLMHLRPQAIHDVSRDWLSWLGLAGFLPCFNIIAGQINTLRRRMRKSEARFRSLAAMSSDFYWESDAEHRLSDRGSADRKKIEFPAFQQGPRPGQRRWDLDYLSPDEAGWQAHRAVLDAHQPFRDFELSRLEADGSERHTSLSGDPVFGAAGEFKGYRGVGTDITASKLAKQALRVSAEELHVLANNVPAMIVSWDTHLRCRFANKAYVAMFELAAGNVVGKQLREVVGEAVYREVESHFKRALQGYPVAYQRDLQRRNGEIRHLGIRLLPNFDDQGKVLGLFSVISDITEYKLTEERIQRVAHHDDLTGLPNRLLFNDRLNQAIALARRDSRGLALLYLDLDRFKPVNDALGHGAGDELLKEVAARIRRQVRESDTVARVGGDEFTVLLPDVASRAKAEVIAKKIGAALAEPFRLGSDNQGVEIGTSIGIAVYPADAQDAETLVKAADAAMYGAKQSGNQPVPRAA